MAVEGHGHGHVVAGARPYVAGQFPVEMMLPDVLHDQAPGELGEIVADADRTDQIAVFIVLEQKIQDPFPQKEKFKKESC